MLPRPKRRKPVKMMVRESTVIRSPGHLKWTRGFDCCLSGRSHVIHDSPNLIGVVMHVCHGRMHAHHCREGATGGTGMKPDDSTAVPLCELAHEEIHRTGFQTFEKKWAVDLSKVSENLWLISPHGKAYRARNLIP